MALHPITKANAREMQRRATASRQAKAKLLASLIAERPPDNIRVLNEHLVHVDELIKHCNRSAELDRLASARSRFQDQLLQLQNPVQSQPKRNGKAIQEARPEAKPIGYTTTGSVQGNLD